MRDDNNLAIVPNIIVFGQTGAGKSSIINMLAGNPSAEVSDSARGCTHSNTRYSVTHGGNNYTFWDTAGLNEDEEGSVSSRAAVQKLLNLVRDQGVNLLIYCIRGRLVNIIRVNYDLFWGIVCREGVPIMLVVTGLEGKGEMEDWWRENERAIKKMKMSFDGHACITSWKGRDDIYEREYKESTMKVWNLVTEHCKQKTWYMPSEWPPQAQIKVEEYMTQKLGGKPLTGRVHNIILFGEAGAGKSSLVNMIVGKDIAKVSSSAEGCTFKSEAYEAIIDNTTFNIYDTAGLNEGDQGRVPHWAAIKGLYTLIRQLDGVSLLVCCIRGRFKENTSFNWILFNKVICGEKVPIIAIVTGLETYDDPDEWWRSRDNKSAFKTNGMMPKAVGCVVSYIGRQGEHANIYAESQTKVRRLIMQNHRQEPWSEEKDKWFADIYYSMFTTRLCFLGRSKLEHTKKMREMISKLIEVSDMDQVNVQKLEHFLINAEKEFRKRGSRFT